jgi:YfiH family protein
MTMPPSALQPILAAPLMQEGIRHAFFTRQGGASGGIYASLNGGQGSDDDPAAVAINRDRMAGFMGVPSGHLLSCWQIHSADVVSVTTPWTRDQRPKADGMVTNRPGLCLAIATADCGPVLFADTRAKVIGACHSGWKGAFTGILEATLDGMEALGAKRADIHAVLGPTISARAYEVGPEFVARFIDTHPDFAAFFIPSTKAGHAMFDLPAFIGHRLQLAQVGSFTNLDRCTYGEPELFFSYRRTTHAREPDYGRLMAAIALTSC